MLQQTKDYLEQKQAFTGPLPTILDKVVESIPYETIPIRMKQVIAVSEIITYASQFRRNILHWNGTEVPINTVGFVITGSGQNKDSSVKAARSSFKLGYKQINEKRKDLAKTAAIRKAEDAGEDNPTDFSVYKDYYSPPPPEFIAPTTGPGFIEHLNNIDELPLGAGLLFTGEVGDELATNPDMLENIKILSEVYDVGSKESKYTKGKESRSKAIDGLPVSALFVGSPAYILYDEATKKKFNIAFASKLARRSWFCFVPGTIKEEAYDDIKTLIDTEIETEDNSFSSREQITEAIKKFTTHQLSKNNQLVTIDRSVRELFIVYKRYNTEVAENVLNPHSVSALIRRHLQWKALKFAGAIAMFELSDSIEEHHYIQAIRFCELLSEDMNLFETELNKTPYEHFADYMHTITDHEGEATMTLHELKKREYIASVANPAAKLKELKTAASSYDKTGIYTINADSTAIHYKKIIKTDRSLISYKKVDNTPIFNAIEKGLGKDALRDAKTAVAKTAATGFTTAELTFDKLAEMLQGDFAYTPFALRDGKRGKDYIDSGAKWLVLDIDKSTVTAEEAHFMLEDINHHIALSSDKNNHFKFRILIELDSEVDLSSTLWRYFTQAVANDLGLEADKVSQSHIYFSYSDREVLSVTDAQPLAVKEYIDEANELSSNKPSVTEKKLTNPQKQALLADELTTFARAFEAGQGSRSIELIKAAYYAKDLGMTKQEIIDLMVRINEYWSEPLEENRFQNTIISQIQRWD